MLAGGPRGSFAGRARHGDGESLAHRASLTVLSMELNSAYLPKGAPNEPSPDHPVRRPPAHRLLGGGELSAHEPARGRRDARDRPRTWRVAHADPVGGARRGPRRARPRVGRRRPALRGPRVRHAPRTDRGGGRDGAASLGGRRPHGRGPRLPRPALRAGRPLLRRLRAQPGGAPPQRRAPRLPLRLRTRAGREPRRPRERAPHRPHRRGPSPLRRSAAPVDRSGDGAVRVLRRSLRRGRDRGDREARPVDRPHLRRARRTPRMEERPVDHGALLSTTTPSTRTAKRRWAPSSTRRSICRRATLPSSRGRRMSRTSSTRSPALRPDGAQSRVRTPPSSRSAESGSCVSRRSVGRSSSRAARAPSEARAARGSSTMPAIVELRI